MGASESSLLLPQSPAAEAQPQPAIDEITTVSHRVEGVDPIRHRIQALKIAEPILKSPPQTESSLTDILEKKAKKISEKQEEIEIKIETADALAVKLLQRFNFSVSSMRTTAHSFAEVQPLQIEVGALKGRLTEVINNCDALCKRIAAEGPEALRSSLKPFSANSMQAQGQPLVRHTQRP